MPKPTRTTVRRPSSRGERRTRVVVATALMVIDHERLQREAWAEFHAARKRLDKSARDLHRHEEIDVPEYESWLHRTFPIQVTTLRELHAEVAAKALRVRAVQMQALYSGGSLKRLWRQQKERESNPERFPRDREPEPEGNGAAGRRRYDAHLDDFEPPPSRSPSSGAREIYRRLVQRLHPDRGGEWTAVRKRLWHEVQEAWRAADADWLSRLEIEWETAHDVIGPKSPLSRLRTAIAELHAARRDTERKLREYRSSPPWRFTRNENNRAQLHFRTKRNFEHDIEFLRAQLEHLNRTIAAWEDDWTRADSVRKHRHRRLRRY